MTELLQLMDAFEGHETFYITFDDVFTQDLSDKYLIKERRSLLFTVIVVFFKTLFIFFKERPKVIVSTGSYIAIPAFFIGRFLFRSKVIFVESVAQVTTPSLTAKILYPVSNLFFVQWESMLEKCGSRAKYCGGLI